MLNKLKLQSTFYKYFVSYIIIWIIPLGFLSWILYQTSIINFQDEIERSSYYKLSQIRDVIDQRIIELQKVALEINRNWSLKPFVISSDTYKTMQGIDELSKYKASNMFLCEIYLYYRNTDLDSTIYSSGGIISLDRFSRKLYENDKKRINQFYSDIKHSQSPLIRSSEKVVFENNNTREVITFIYPLPLEGNQHYASLVVFVDKSIFDNMIADLLGNVEGSAYIIDDKNSVLVSVNYEKHMPFSIISDEFDVKTDNARKYVRDFRYNGMTFSMVNVMSDITGWKFAVAMPSYQFRRQVHDIKKMIVIMLLILIVLCLVMAYILSIKNYKPIKILSEYSMKSIPEEGEQYEANEFERIRLSIENVLNKNRGLSELLEMQRPLIKDQVFEEILKGNAKDKSNIKKLLEFINVRISGLLYFVFIVRNSIDSKHCVQSKNNDSVMDLINSYFDVDTIIHVLQSLSSDNVIFVASLSRKDHINRDQFALADKIKLLIEDALGMDVTIGIGKTYDNLLHINSSFVEALAALEYRQSQGRQDIIFFEEVLLEKGYIYKKWYPVEHQLRFIQCLKQGIEDSALENLQSMMNSISGQRISGIMEKYIFFDIVNDVVKTVNNVDKEGRFERDIDELMKFNSINDLKLNLESLVKNLCRYINNSKLNDSRLFFNSIMEYLNRHFKDYDLSIENVADAFNISIYQLSRLFKEQSGINFTDYVINLRTEEVKMQLKGTKKTLKEIVNEVGYSDIPSFMRKFKRMEGITPGQYRKSAL